MKETFIRYCLDHLDLDSVKLSPEYFYASLPHCVVDAIFSIGVRYSSTRSTVIRFCEYYGFKRLRDYGTDYPTKAGQVSVQQILSLFSNKTDEELSNNVFDNRQRTSTRNGVLKSEAVRRFLICLHEYDVQYFQDVHKVMGNESFESCIKSIQGQRSGISLSYFFMLAGDSRSIKPDRMILRFIREATGKSLTINDASDLIKTTADVLKKDYPALTPRALDHTIWLYQRSK